MDNHPQGKERRSCHRAQPVLQDGDLCQAELTSADGAQACAIVDVSVGGALVRSENELKVDAAVNLGGVDGHVLRHQADGTAIRFDAESNHVKLQVSDAA